jgi:hypothetical protein
MTLPYVDGAAVGTHPLVSWMCKGSFERRPPPRKVPSVWDPTPVLDIFMHWPLSYAQPVRKCAFILAILSGIRLSELFGLKCDVSHLQISNDFVQLVPASLSKTDRAGRIGPPICFNTWREDSSLCPVAVIRALLEARDALNICHDPLFQCPLSGLHSDPRNFQRIHHEKPPRSRHRRPARLHMRHRSFIRLRQGFKHRRHPSDGELVRQLHS